MKKQLMTTMMVAIFFAMLSVASVHAQDAGNLVASIPFDFAISGKTLPAGEYFVRRSFEGSRVLIEIRGRDKTQAVYLPTHSAYSMQIQPESKLVFNRYGEQHFLSQVWISGRSVGEELTKTPKERLLQREMAKRSTKPQTVAIAGRAN